ncbi:cupin domain-containing protein [Sulfurovum sp.]|uniref:cupin domain-containing protein n=1 Tax=Sulfurovum sp. TaxID=1969726 RepID=UPI0025DCF839|nr:cupin domain-containing protein [Sulfurovum sp.]
MFKRNQKMRSSLLPLLTLLLLTAFSTLTANEPALKYSFDDKELKWGPCPAFIPKGCEIAVLHGDPGQKNADLFFKVPGDFTIPHHWHTSPERMVLVSGKMKVTYDNQKTETLNVGNYAYGPAKRPHVAYCEKGDPCVLFIAFENPVDAFEVMEKSP